MASSHVLGITGALTLIFLFSQALVPAYAATSYTITVQTASPSYSGAQPIAISGVVSPAPGANTAVIITIKNSAGSVADVVYSNPDPSSGSYSGTSVPGGNPAWTAGTFTVNATWGGNGSTASMVTTFTYSPTVTTTTTTTVSTSDTSTTSVTTTAATSATTTSTAPEFPSSALAVVALVAVAMVAALSRKGAFRPAGSLGR